MIVSWGLIRPSCSNFSCNLKKFTYSFIICKTRLLIKLSRHLVDIKCDTNSKTAFLLKKNLSITYFSLAFLIFIHFIVLFNLLSVLPIIFPTFIKMFAKIRWDVRHLISKSCVNIYRFTWLFPRNSLYLSMYLLIGSLIQTTLTVTVQQVTVCAFWVFWDA